MHENTVAVLVARYLKANHYDQTLEAFLRETQLPAEAATTRSEDWTLEKVVEEKNQFDTSLAFERIENEGDRGWVEPAPSIPEEVDSQADKNVLCVAADNARDAISVTTAGHDLKLFSARSPHSGALPGSFQADSPILSTKFVTQRYLASTCMSGRFTIHDLDTGNLVAGNRIHTKWAVDLAVFELSDSSSSLVATAGWDQKVYVYNLKHESFEQTNSELQPIGVIEVPTNPVSLLFVKHPDKDQIYLVLARRDSSFLYYYSINTAGQASSVEAVGRQNLAPHSNAWVAFTPSALAQHPSDPCLVAIATSHLPHLKVILVRLLFPGDSSIIDAMPVDTAAGLARRDLAVQDREDQAIKLQVSTHAPQTPYSTPQIVWRPNGSGVWVNGDDGVIRGLEIKTGKVKAYLKAHEVGSKVRTLWAGALKNAAGEDEEVLVSGGFDRKTFVWHIPTDPVS